MERRYSQLCPNCFSPAFAGKCAVCDYLSISRGEDAVLLKPGSVLQDRFVVGRALGLGGFGVTYLALDTFANEKVAIKEYFPTDIAVRDTQTGGIYASNRGSQDVVNQGRKKFMDEAAILSRFKGEPAIVQVMDCFEAHDTAYFVMEYLEGVDLRALVRSVNNSLPPNLACEIIVSVGKALDVVHRQGLLHRDISPENIFITKTGAVKLIDFGATRQFVGERSRNLTVILKAGFAPPEQYISKGVQGPWTDIYALAATFYNILTGLAVPDAFSRQNGSSLAKLNAIVPGVPVAQSDAIDRALSLKYQERYQTMGDFLAAFQNEADRGQVMPITPSLQGTPFVVYQSGSEVHKWIVPKNMDMVIGRSPEQCHIVINEEKISRVHCMVRFDEKAMCFYLQDVSTNGTYLSNGQQIAKNEVYTLQSGESFNLLSNEYSVRLGWE
jgi:serine/threonine protein kinase